MSADLAPLRPPALPQAPYPLRGCLRVALPPRGYLVTAVAVWGAVTVLVAGLLWWKERLARVPEVVGLVGLVGLLIIMAIGWILFAGRVVQLNTPEAARLVPGQPRALRRTLVLGAMVMVGVAVFSARALALMFDLQALPHAWVACVTLAVCCVSLWGARHPMFWIFIWPAFSLGFGSPAMKRLWGLGAEVAAGPAGLPLVVVMGLLMSLLIQHAVLEGGERHVRQQRRMRGWEAASRGTPQINAGREDGDAGWFSMAAWAAPAARLYDRWSERVLARRAPSAGARAMLCFGPSLHPASAVGSAFWLVIGTVIFMGGRWAWRTLSGSPAADKGLLMGLVMGVAMGGAFALMGLAIHVRHVLWRTRTEQALMTLAPGVPRGGALSRRLALHMGAVMCTWAMVLAVPFLILWAAEDPGRLRESMDKLPFALLAWVPMLWAFVPDWSRLQDPARRIWPLIIAAGVLFMIVLAAGAVGSEWRQRLDLAGVTIGVAGLAWRWWRMGREPAALPVGSRG